MTNTIVLEPELLFPIAVCDDHLAQLSRTDPYIELMGPADGPCSKCQAERSARRRRYADMPAASLFPPAPNPLTGPDPTVRDWGDADDIIRETYRGQGV